ncbi:hypothetical protein J2R99_003410 [Rhodopseudomonas julia]|uniref:Uncharacterized protein n=1 Tax=Rhodopseudomonas julia TaxID=200617 RepID=A0ABU0CAK0_9BRAD|nr:hypothetical protein [Rhodopseudomonas julia]MDQ0327541.1 hypothetical protein [Rhodopseudomonas julia]
MNTVPATGATVRKLQERIREARIRESDRMDGIVDLRETERARLELLAEEMAGVAEELPERDRDRFLMSILPGDPPRYWVDATSFVMMGRDKRTFRFLQDTLNGRIVLAEANDAGSMADRVTTHLAERIVERERALAADDVETARHRRLADARQIQNHARSRLSGFWVFLAFIIGIIVGASALLAYAWLTVA